MERMIPEERQERAIKRMLEEPTNAALNGSLMGTGKTLMAVEVAKRRGDKVILIIAPLGTRLGWQRTFAQQGVDLPFQWINSTKAGVAAQANWQWQLPGIYFVGTEMFVRLGWEDDLNKCLGEKFDGEGNQVFKDGKPVLVYAEKRSGMWAERADIVLFDEAHRSQNRSSKTFKTLKQVNAGYKMSMSGTPAGNKIEGAWAVTRWLWPELIEAGFYNWVNRWCVTEYDRFSPRNIKVVGEKQPGAFFEFLPCYIRLENELGEPPKPELRMFQLSPQERKPYDELEQDMVTYVADNPLVIEFPIVLQARLRQATLGQFDVSEDGEVSFELDCRSSKINLMHETLEKDFEKESALILTDSQKFADVAVHRINQKYGEGSAAAWHGNVSQTKREEIKSAFMKGELKYIVAVISALAEGVDGLQFGTRNVLWLSRSSNRLMNFQAIFRVFRRGQENEVRNIELVAIDTLDEGVLSSQMRAQLEMNKTLRAGRDTIE